MKKIVTSVICILIASFGYAQNIAPQATASASTCNTGACATLNDLAYGTCGTQSMWITSSATNPGSAIFIQFTWPTVKVVNKITFFVGEQANRFLGGGTVQQWNGTAWVNHSTFTQTTGVCSYTINFAAVATTQIRIIDIVVIGTQSSNVNFREIEIYGPNYNNDAGVTSLTSIVPCTSPQKLDVTVSNFGKKRLDSFRLTWSVNNTNMGTKYLASSLTTGQSTTINLDPAFNFTPSTIYNIKAWTSYPNGFSKDSGVSNDTILNKTEFLGVPGLPTVSNSTQCGRGNVSLIATPTNTKDTIVWYSTATLGVPVAFGKNATGPFIVQTTTFYAQAAKIAKASSTLTNAAVGTLNLTQTNAYGAMFNVTATNNCVMDSLLFRLYYATPTNMGFQFYYKTGTYVGSQTIASAWTLGNQGVITFVTIAGAYYAKISTKSLFLHSGQTYGFYVTSDINLGAGNSMYVTSAAPTVSNTDISMLTSGSLILGKFGATSVTANYLPDMTFLYKKECVAASRVPVVVTVKPSPIGTDVKPGAIFEGQFRNGSNFNPDVLEVNKTNIYELQPPTGYTNAGHGTTWYISSISAKTKSNVVVPSTEYSATPPTAGGPGTLTFKPSSFYRDSLITFSINFADLGPYFCDSTLKRAIYVAPTPKVNFKLPIAGCSGNEVFLDNLSTISKGNISFKWYFGDGDSSDVNTPTHIFKSTGVYNIRLVATSDFWTVKHDTTLTLFVEEKPKMKFNIVNRCFGIALTMNNNTTISSGGTLKFTWKFGDGSSAITNSLAPLSKSYAAAGAYRVTLVADNKGCSDSFTKNAYQFLKPKADFIKDYGTCLNEPFKFTNTSTSLDGEYGNVWDFGDNNGNFASDLSTIYTFETAGTKNVKLKVISEFNCMDSIIKPFVVKQSPTSDFSFPFACERTPTPFTNLTNLYGESLVSYTWNFDQGNPVFVTNPVVSWNSLGRKNVTLKTVLANGCSSQVTKPLDVGVQPVVDFEFENQCEGNEAIFTNLTTHRFGDINYKWTFGDGSFSNLQSPTHTFTGAQTFFVQLNASVVNGCTDSAIKTINISQLPPTCDFDFARNWPVGSKNFVFTPKGGSMTGIKYVWLMGDGQKLTSNGTGVNYTFNNILRYCVTMKASNQADCECSATKCLDVYTGLDNVTRSEFKIFPNPSAGIFNISGTDGFSNVKVEVFNVLGSLVKSYQFDGITNAIMDLTELNNGVYMVSIHDKYQTITQKINIVK